MHESTLNSLKQTFADNLGMKWRDLLDKTGEFLLQAKDKLNFVLFKALKAWLKQEYNISESQQDVCIRVARGEISQELANFLPPSLAKNIATENLPDLDKEYVIYSPEEGGPITKKARNFTKQEKKINIGPHGIKDLSTIEGPEEIKPFARAFAKSYRIEEQHLILVVPSIQKEVAYRITKALVNEIAVAVKND